VTTNDNADNAAALRCLRSARTCTRFAAEDARDAVPYLVGARGDRAAELAEMLSAALKHTERLIVVVTGDLRADHA